MAGVVDVSHAVNAKIVTSFAISRTLAMRMASGSRSGNPVAGWDKDVSSQTRAEDALSEQFALII
jgi:hypothetical protein